MCCNNHGCTDGDLPRVAASVTLYRSPIISSSDGTLTCREQTGAATGGHVWLRLPPALSLEQSHPDPALCLPAPGFASSWREKVSVAEELSRCEVGLLSPWSITDVQKCGGPPHLQAPGEPMATQPPTPGGTERNPASPPPRAPWQGDLSGRDSAPSLPPCLHVGSGSAGRGTQMGQFQSNQQNVLRNEVKCIVFAPPTWGLARTRPETRAPKLSSPRSTAAARVLLFKCIQSTQHSTLGRAPGQGTASLFLKPFGRRDCRVQGRNSLFPSSVCSCCGINAILAPQLFWSHLWPPPASPGELTSLETLVCLLRYPEL